MSSACQNSALNIRQQLLLGGSLTAVFAMPSIALAAEASPVISPLDTVSVVATKSAHKAFDLPAMVTVVDVNEPAVAASSRIKDVLRDVPGVEFDGQFFVDPALLKKIEVVRGPSSTLYGAGGLGGVVAFETVSASDLLAPGENSGAAMSLANQSVNNEWLVSATGFMRNDQFDALASIVSRNSGDIALGDGSDLAADDEVISGLVKFGYSLTPQSTFKIDLQHYQNDSREPNNPQSSSSLDLYDKTTTSTTASLRYLYDEPGNDLLALTSRVYYTDTEIEESERHSARDMSRQLDSLGFSLENKSRFGLGRDFSQTFHYGFEFYRENQEGSDNSGFEGEAGGIPDAETDFWGVFIQDEIRIVGVSGLPGEFFIVPGLRLDNYAIENAAGVDLDADEVSPKLAVSYAPQTWLMVFAHRT